MLPFVKMHGCGNDFVLLRAADVAAAGLAAEDGTPRDAAALARRVCDRHYGVGADGLLVYGTGLVDGCPAPVRMLYWNSDGTRAEMCGNGARCVVRLAHDRGESASPLVLETDAGPRRAEVHAEDGGAVTVTLAMGRAAWDPPKVPVDASEPLVLAPLRVGEDELRVTALSVGNPHAVVFVPTLEALGAVPLERLGRGLSEHERFPHGANASFVAEANGALHVRVWERGAGPTLACGTASCAVLAAAAFLGRVPAPRAVVHLPGGTVEVRQDPDGELWLTGPAVYVAHGTLSPELLAVAPR